MNKLLSLTVVGLASVAINLASPAVSQAWVYAPGQQPQPRNYAPSYFNNYNYGYSGNYGYVFGSYGYRGYGYNAFSYSGHPGLYGGYNIYPNPIVIPGGAVIQPQFGVTSPYGYYGY